MFCYKPIPNNRVYIDEKKLHEHTQTYIYIYIYILPTPPHEQDTTQGAKVNVLHFNPYT